MKKIHTIATTFVLSMTIAGFASADTGHGHMSNSEKNATGTAGQKQSDMQHNMMHKMMPMMMRMHRQMGNAGMTGSGSMMDKSMMQMMMGPGMMGQGMGPGHNADAFRETALKRLGEFDSNKDGSLSLEEFEALHAAMIRETTVDRFQHLDADGDGKITEKEISAPAERMNMSGMRNGGAGMMGMGKPSDN